MSSSTPTLLQFGAGNIGRSFVGQLFAQSGYEVVFVDVAEPLIAALNREKSYRVMVKHPDKAEETIWIRNVRGLHGTTQANAVVEAVAEADMAATSVGARALPFVLPSLARGLMLRRERDGNRPLDVILAENLHGAADFCRAELRKHLPEDFPLDTMVGLVETSIGKMVPIMREADVAKDPLWVFAEPYNELILDGSGFRNAAPKVEGLHPVQNIQAYVDRKLYIHNLGHSATAYLGYAANPAWEYIYEPLEAGLHAEVKRCMMQSSEILCREHPAEFTLDTLEAHVDDLLSRFSNRALGDTIHRVGRDLFRKLARHDRLVGALILGKKHGLPTHAISRAILAGIGFRKGDDQGALFSEDSRFVAEMVPLGLARILDTVCELRDSDPLEAAARKEIQQLERG